MIQIGGSLPPHSQIKQFIMRTRDIDFTFFTLISVCDYQVLGNVLIIPKEYREFIFSTREEMDNFIKNNPHLDLDSDYIIPQIASKQERGEYEGIKHIIYLGV